MNGIEDSTDGYLTNFSTLLSPKYEFDDFSRFPQTIQSVFLQGKLWANSFNQLAKTPISKILAWEGSEQLPSYRLFVEKVTQAFGHQSQINQINAKLNSFNYAINMANSIRNRQLMELIERGQQHISQLTLIIHQQSKSLQELELSMDGLSEDLAAQQGSTDELKDTLSKTKNELQMALMENKQELERQQEAILEQQKSLERLVIARRKQDFVVDGITAFLAAWAVNSFLINYSIRTSSLFLPIPTQMQGRFRKTIKCVLFSIVFIYLRRGFIKSGIHTDR